MLGFVKQEMLDSEREARLKAEGESRFLSANCKMLETRINELLDERDHAVAALRAEQESHIKEVGLLLDHFKPPAPEQPSSPDTADRPAATYDEIMAEPASTKREMYAREMRANRAREAQRTKAESDAIATRRANLTAEELEANRPDGVYDDMLGVNLPEPAEDSETHVN